MKIKDKNGEVNILLGIRDDEFLVTKDKYNLQWIDKRKFEKLTHEPEYLKIDENKPAQKVVEILKVNHDLDYFSGKLTWNESIIPLFFQRKRIQIALETALGNKIEDSAYGLSDKNYFYMLVGKFELINEIIDSKLQMEESHSRFEWVFSPNESSHFKTNIDSGKPIEGFEQKLIELCEFVSKKVNSNDDYKIVFTDLYSTWKAFLLGNEVEIFEITGNSGKPSDNEFNWSMLNAEGRYYFKYQYFDW